MSSKKIVVKCCDKRGRSFEVEEPVAMLSELLKNLLEDDINEIEAPNIRSDTMYMVLEYCKDRSKAKDEKELKQCDKLFASIFKEPYHCKPKQLIQIMKAADYLAIPTLIDISCEIMADLLSHKTPLQIRKEFHITGDNTPEVEARAKAWRY